MGNHVVSGLRSPQTFDPPLPVRLVRHRIRTAQAEPLHPIRYPWSSSTATPHSASYPAAPVPPHGRLEK